MKKITIIALHLGFGGIEKAISSLANMLCKEYEIEIISTYKLYDKPSFFIDSKVKVNYLISEKPNKKELLYSIKKFNIVSLFNESLKSLKVLYLRKKCMIDAIKKSDSDIIISTRPFHNTLIGKYANENTLKIAWEHSHHNNNNKYIRSLINSCKNVNYLISVSKELNEFYSSRVNSTCKYISLSLDSFPNKTSLLDKNEITVVGRLSKEKGFLDLIDVFKLINIKYPNWHLNIVGDGIEKNNILKKIEQNKLEKFITMHGFKEKDEVNKVLSNSSIYVMTSFTESFGLVLIEAMSYGIPCISFDSARGSLEIIDNNINGFIIENRNKEEMAKKIIFLIKNNKVRKEMGNNARVKSLNFKQENIKDKWISLINGK